MDDRDTIRRIKQNVVSGAIPAVFEPADVNKALKIHWAGNVAVGSQRDGQDAPGHNSIIEAYLA